MKKALIVISLLITLGANAQTIHRSQWSLQPKVRSSSLSLMVLANRLETTVLYLGEVDEMDSDEYADFVRKCSWFLPEFTWTWSINSISSPDGAKIAKPFWWRELLWGDYSHTFNFSAGYELAWKHLISPFGAYAGVNWEYSHYSLKNCAEAGDHISQAIVPGAGLRFRLWGGSFEKQIKPALEIGGAYVCNFKYHGPHNYSKDALNNGFRGHVSLGVELPSIRTTFLIEYQHDFFDKFDTGYTVKETGEQPFKGYSTTHGEVALRGSFSF